MHGMHGFCKESERGLPPQLFIQVLRSLAKTKHLCCATSRLLDACWHALSASLPTLLGPTCPRFSRHMHTCSACQTPSQALPTHPVLRVWQALLQHPQALLPQQQQVVVRAATLLACCRGCQPACMTSLTATWQCPLSCGCKPTGRHR